VDHEVVAGMAQHRNRGTGDARAGVNRTHVRDASNPCDLRFVNGRDAEFAERAHDGRLRAANSRTITGFMKTLPSPADTRADRLRRT
jgi:hypothetical protein